MTLADWALALGALALIVLGFAIPGSRLEARAKDEGHGFLFVAAISALVFASWPGYWLGMRVLDLTDPSKSSVGGRK